MVGIGLFGLDDEQPRGTGPDQRPHRQPAREVLAAERRGLGAHAVAHPGEVGEGRQRLVGERLRPFDQQPRTATLQEVHAIILSANAPTLRPS
jgi:hypothetical protein